MKSKSYILIATPTSKSQLTDKLLSEILKELPYMDVRTQESTTGRYYAIEAHMHQSDDVTDMATGEGSGGAVISVVNDIIYRVTGDSP